MRRPGWYGALGALVLAVVLWLAPRGLSLYHQERGARLLVQALAVEGRTQAEADPYLLSEPVMDGEARRLAERAADRFRAAVEADPRNGQAYRWLGRAALLLDRPEEAIVAFSAATRLHPANPLAWWELGLAYERLAQGLEGAVHLALASDSDCTAGPVPIAARDVTILTLQVADIETPHVPINTPYCELGEEPESCFVAQAEWEMPDAPDRQPEGWWVPEEPVRRAVLFMHPPARATFTVTLPVTPTALTFWMGIEPTVWPWLGDGVVYRIEVDGEEVFEQELTPEAAREGWRPGAVDLSGWVGREVRLMLETDAGPAGDGQGDWAGWGEVRLVEADSVSCVLASCRERAAVAWREGGFTAAHIHYGKVLYFFDPPLSLHFTSDRIAGKAHLRDNGMWQQAIVPEVSHAQAHCMPFRGIAPVPGTLPWLLQPAPVGGATRRVVPAL